MKITILTLFPEMFAGPFSESIIKHAQNKGLVKIRIVNIRDYGIGAHKVVDDTPYGGGIGMVMRVDVVARAIEENLDKHLPKNKQKVILLSAAGSTFTQRKAEEFAKLDHLVLICGHYEGIDARIEAYIDEEVSIGNFVLTGGEIPAMVITDATTRLISGVLKEGVTKEESHSFEGSLLEYPHYTRPDIFAGKKVPDVLLSGNHKEIASWRKDQAEKKTQKIKQDKSTVGN